MGMKSTSKSTLSASVLVKRLMDFYENFLSDNIEDIDKLSIYSRDIEFIDPIHRVNGLFQVKQYLSSISVNLLHYQVRYIDAVIDEDCAFLTWEMDYAHKKLNNGKMLTLRGMTQVKFTSEIYYHEDYYDLGAMIYEHVPIMGPLTRYVKGRLAG